MTQSQALAIMKTGANIFLTGEPGSGKTYTINQYVNYLRSCGIDVAITASTGIAATHIGGMTIHSWSGIGIKTELSRSEIDKIAANKPVAKRIAGAKVLVIDEISMLPPYALDMVEAVCRRVRRSTDAFGGLQVILVGDFFQLPPIMKKQPSQEQKTLLGELAARFAYGSLAWERAKPVVCYLSEQYRQDDQDFLSLLTAIRANDFSAGHMEHLHKRKINYNQAPSGLPKLYSHNIDVDQVNDEMLAKLPAKGRVYKMAAQGAKNLVESLQRGCLSPERLELKEGAEVMFTKNSPKGLYANGTLGKVEGFDPNTHYPIVVTRGGRIISVEPSEWMMEENDKVLARITQFPLRLAWAITVHKSQGMSLDGAVMDLSSVFEYGQGYVALSRVRRLSGLHLLGWNSRAFEVHPDIVIKDADFKVASEAGLVIFDKMSPAKLENLHNEFVKSRGGKIGSVVFKKTMAFEAPKKAKVDTYKETLALWQAGKTLSEISAERQLQEGTILAHLEKLGEQGKIKSAEFSKLLSETLNSALPAIGQVFRKLDTDKLGPVYEYLDGRYSYDELRLARLVLRDKLK